jgi:hypothetical protein
VTPERLFDLILASAGADCLAFTRHERRDLTMNMGVGFMNPAPVHWMWRLFDVTTYQGRKVVTFMGVRLVTVDDWAG